MIISTTEKSSVTTFFLAGSLLFLTGCFGGEKKELKDADQACVTTDKGELLLSIDGKPVLYVQDFEEQKAMAMQSDPRLQMILQVMPNADKDMIFEALKSAHVLKEWAHRQGIDQTDDFKKDLQNIKEAYFIQMCMKAYQEAHPITVTEKEAREYYESRKSTIPGLAISGEGIDVLCAKFDKKEDAERFAHKVKDGSKKHFEAAGKELHVNVSPMVISEESYADEVLKNAALSVTKFPSKDIVKMSDGSYMVIGMTGKKAAEYHSFDIPEVKKGITDMCMNEKREEAQKADVARLAKEYNVVEDTTYFDKKAEVAANIQKSLQQAHHLAMSAEQPTEDMVICEEEIIFEDKI